MDNNELNRIADLIWSILNSIENEKKTRAEQIALIKPVILDSCMSSRRTGRRQILNYLEDEIKGLR